MSKLAIFLFISHMLQHTLLFSEGSGTPFLSYEVALYARGNVKPVKKYDLCSHPFHSWMCVGNRIKIGKSISGSNPLIFTPAFVSFKPTKVPVLPSVLQTVLPPSFLTTTERIETDFINEDGPNGDISINSRENEIEVYSEQDGRTKTLKHKPKIENPTSKGNISSETEALDQSLIDHKKKKKPTINPVLLKSNSGPVQQKGGISSVNINQILSFPVTKSKEEIFKNYEKCSYSSYSWICFSSSKKKTKKPSSITQDNKSHAEKKQNTNTNFIQKPKSSRPQKAKHIFKGLCRHPFHSRFCTKIISSSKNSDSTSPSSASDQSIVIKDGTADNEIHSKKKIRAEIQNIVSTHHFKPEKLTLRKVNIDDRKEIIIDTTNKKDQKKFCNSCDRSKITLKKCLEKNCNNSIKETDESLRTQEQNSRGKLRDSMINKISKIDYAFGIRNESNRDDQCGLSTACRNSRKQPKHSTATEKSMKNNQVSQSHKQNFESRNTVESPRRVKEDKLCKNPFNSEKCVETNVSKSKFRAIFPPLPGSHLSSSSLPHLVHKEATKVSSNSQSKLTNSKHRTANHFVNKLGEDIGTKNERNSPRALLKGDNRRTIASKKVDSQASRENRPMFTADFFKTLYYSNWSKGVNRTLVRVKANSFNTNEPCSNFIHKWQCTSVSPKQEEDKTDSKRQNGGGSLFISHVNSTSRNVSKTRSNTKNSKTTNRKKEKSIYPADTIERNPNEELFKVFNNKPTQNLLSPATRRSLFIVRDENLAKPGTRLKRCRNSSTFWIC